MGSTSERVAARAAARVGGVRRAAAQQDAVRVSAVKFSAARAQREAGAAAMTVQMCELVSLLGSVSAAADATGVSVEDAEELAAGARDVR